MRLIVREKSESDIEISLSNCSSGFASARYKNLNGRYGMTEGIGYLAGVCYLAVCGITDVRKRKVSAAWLFAGIAGGLIWRIVLLVSGCCSLKDLLLCFIPGAVLLLLAGLCGGIGSGDGLAWIGTCLFLGTEAGCMVFLIGFLLSFFWSAVLLIFRRAGRKSRIPFLPFAFAGMIFWIMGVLYG